MIVVDTNILLDIVNRNPVWLKWSAGQMMQLAQIHDLIINPIIYAEFSVSFVLLAEVEKSGSDLGLIVEDLPREATFLAGKHSINTASCAVPRLGSCPTSSSVLTQWS